MADFGDSLTEGDRAEPDFRELMVELKEAPEDYTRVSVASVTPTPPSTDQGSPGEAIPKTTQETVGPREPTEQEAYTQKHIEEISDRFYRTLFEYEVVSSDLSSENFGRFPRKGEVVLSTAEPDEIHGLVTASSMHTDDSQTWTHIMDIDQDAIEQEAISPQTADVPLAQDQHSPITKTIPQISCDISQQPIAFLYEGDGPESIATPISTQLSHDSIAEPPTALLLPTVAEYSSSESTSLQVGFRSEISISISQHSSSFSESTTIPPLTLPEFAFSVTDYRPMTPESIVSETHERRSLTPDSASEYATELEFSVHDYRSSSPESVATVYKDGSLSLNAHVHENTSSTLDSEPPEFRPRSPVPPRVDKYEAPELSEYVLEFGFLSVPGAGLLPLSLPLMTDDNKGRSISPLYMLSKTKASSGSTSPASVNEYSSISPELVGLDFDDRALSPDLVHSEIYSAEIRPASPDSIASINEHRPLSPDSPTPEFRLALLDCNALTKTCRSSSPESVSSNTESIPLSIELSCNEPRLDSPDSVTTENEFICVLPDSPIPQYGHSITLSTDYRSLSAKSIYSDTNDDTLLLFAGDRMASPESTISVNEFRGLSPDSPIPDFKQTIPESTFLKRDHRSSSPESESSDTEHVLLSLLDLDIESRPASPDSLTSVNNDGPILSQGDVSEFKSVQLTSVQLEAELVESVSENSTKHTKLKAKTTKKKKSSKSAKNTVEAQLTAPKSMVATPTKNIPTELTKCLTEYNPVEPVIANPAITDIALETESVTLHEPSTHEATEALHHKEPGALEFTITARDIDKISTTSLTTRTDDKLISSESTINVPKDQNIKLKSTKPADERTSLLHPSATPEPECLFPYVSGTKRNPIIPRRLMSHVYDPQYKGETVFSRAGVFQDVRGISPQRSGATDKASQGVRYSCEEVRTMSSAPCEVLSESKVIQSVSTAKETVTEDHDALQVSHSVATQLEYEPVSSDSLLENTPLSSDSVSEFRSLCPDSPVPQYSQTIIESIRYVHRSPSPESTELDSDLELTDSRPLTVEDRPSSPESTASLNEYRHLSPDSPIPQFSRPIADSVSSIIANRSSSPESLASDIDFISNINDFTTTEYRSESPESVFSEIEDRPLSPDSVYEYRTLTPESLERMNDLRSSSLESVTSFNEFTSLSPDSPVPQYSQTFLECVQYVYRSSSPESIELDSDLELTDFTLVTVEERPSSPESIASINEYRHLSPDSPVLQFSLILPDSASLITSYRTSSPESLTSDVDFMPTIHDFITTEYRPESPESVFSEIEDRPSSPDSLAEYRPLSPDTAMLMTDIRVSSPDSRASINENRSLSPDSPIPQFTPKTLELATLGTSSLSPESLTSDTEYTFMWIESVTSEIRSSSPDSMSSVNKYRPLSPDSPVPQFACVLPESTMSERGERSSSPQSESSEMECELVLPLPFLTKGRAPSPDSTGSLNELRPLSPDSPVPEFGNVLVEPIMILSGHRSCSPDSIISDVSQLADSPMPELAAFFADFRSSSPESITTSDEFSRLSPDSPTLQFPLSCIAQYTGPREYRTPSPLSVTSDTELIVLSSFVIESRASSPESTASVTEHRCLSPDSPIPEFRHSLPESVLSICSRSSSPVSVPSDTEYILIPVDTLSADHRPSSPESLLSEDLERPLSPDSVLEYRPLSPEWELIMADDRVWSPESENDYALLSPDSPIPDNRHTSLDPLMVLTENRALSPVSITSLDESRPLSPDSPIQDYRSISPVPPVTIYEMSEFKSQFSSSEIEERPTSLLQTGLIKHDLTSTYMEGCSFPDQAGLATGYRSFSPASLTSDIDTRSLSPQSTVTDTGVRAPSPEGIEFDFGHVIRSSPETCINFETEYRPMSPESITSETEETSETLPSETKIGSPILPQPVVPVMEKYIKGKEMAISKIGLLSHVTSEILPQTSMEKATGVDTISPLLMFASKLDVDQGRPKPIRLETEMEKQTEDGTPNQSVSGQPIAVLASLLTTVEGDDWKSLSKAGQPMADQGEQDVFSFRKGTSIDRKSEGRVSSESTKEIPLVQQHKMDIDHTLVKVQTDYDKTPEKDPQTSNKITKTTLSEPTLDLSQPFPDVSLVPSEIKHSSTSPDFIKTLTTRSSASSQSREGSSSLGAPALLTDALELVNTSGTMNHRSKSEDIPVGFHPIISSSLQFSQRDFSHRAVSANLFGPMSETTSRSISEPKTPFSPTSGRSLDLPAPDMFTFGPSSPSLSLTQDSQESSKETSESLSPTSSQIHEPPDYEVMYSRSGATPSECYPVSPFDLSPVSPVFSDSPSESSELTKELPKAPVLLVEDLHESAVHTPESPEAFQLTPDFKRVLLEFEKSLAAFGPESSESELLCPPVQTKTLLDPSLSKVSSEATLKEHDAPILIHKAEQKARTDLIGEDSEQEFYDCRQTFSDSSEPELDSEPSELKRELKAAYHIEEPPSLPSSPDMGYLKGTSESPSDAFLLRQERKHLLSSGSEDFADSPLPFEPEELPSREGAHYEDDDDSLGREIAEELGSLSDSSEEEVLTTRVVRRRVIIQSDVLPDIPPQTVTEEQYTDEHGNMVVKKITRKVIRKFVSADGTERDEFTLEGSRQEPVAVEEGDVVSRVVRRTVVRSEGDQREVTFSEPMALGGATASSFEGEQVQGRKVSKVIKTTVVKGERMEKQTGDPSLASDLPSAKEDFEKALSYAGGFGKMLLPHLVEEAVVKADGSLVKRTQMHKTRTQKRTVVRDSRGKQVLLERLDDTPEALQPDDLHQHLHQLLWRYCAEEEEDKKEDGEEGPKE